MPKDSLKFFYGPDDDSDSKGGFTTVSVGTDTMNITFYNYKGTHACTCIVTNIISPWAFL